MRAKLFESAIYTIATYDRITAAAKNHEPLRENRKWTKGKQLFEEAQEQGAKLPIFFADSRDCSKLLGWGFITKIDILESHTNYEVGSLHGLSRYRPQDLTRLTTGKKIAPYFIRPYCLVHTPDFLYQQLLKPRPWRNARWERKALEGRRILVAHQRLERDRALIARFKQDYRERNEGSMPCEVCGFDFAAAYGNIGINFAEAHHRIALSKSSKQGRTTSFKDLAIVCANCHRMLHKGPEYPDIKSLKGRVRKALRQ